jgi:hypothetical protein
VLWRCINTTFERRLMVHVGRVVNRGLILWRRGDVSPHDDCATIADPRWRRATVHTSTTLSRANNDVLFSMLTRDFVYMELWFCVVGP